MPRQLTWRKAIEKVLHDADGALHYTDIANRIIEDKLRSQLGATPSATVASDLSTRISNEGVLCPWEKIGRGLYIWKERTGISSDSKSISEDMTRDIGEEQYAVISSFGMFWRRNAVEWSASPKILGMQQIDAESVDFSKQIGIYLLYDGREIIYVGRTTSRPLGKRLYE